MPEIKAILFDLDGTLTDSALDLSISVNFMLKGLGFPEQPLENIYNYIGRGVRNMLKDALGPEREDKVDDGMKIFRGHYWDHCLDNTVLYPGVEKTVRAFSSMKKAVVTNKTKPFADKILEGLGLFDPFDVILGGDNFPALKPDPSPVLMACELLGVTPAEAIMVGDSINDILSAVRAGAVACGVTYGLGGPDELTESGARWLIDSMDRLQGVIEGVSGS